MQIISSEFHSASVLIEKCPKPVYPEFAFVGRSNVGKSSLINLLLNRKGLAKTSGTPGKTKTINHFIVNKDKDSWYLVDLPGYGYAKVSKSDRNKWETFIRSYITTRENLRCTFVLIDSRIPPQQIDLDFVKWLGKNEIAFAICYTKTDKPKPAVLLRNMEAFELRMLGIFADLPNLFITSAENRKGSAEVLDFIESVMK
ncbi:MAG: ribosome biogenesis GTP-binding protein YihA/YsxC [Flavobacteriales bacterium]|nr:ribosome biogenesis GTP-binding protein YihA/YsxC [Flavobacteriales bacterium]